MEQYIEFSSQPINNKDKSQAELSVSAQDIDWSAFDIVICLDACVSKEITTYYPQTLWAYYVTEGCMSECILSRVRPYDGYDVYLNMRFRSSRDFMADPNLDHEIDFPYHLIDADSFSQLMGPPLDFKQRSGIFRAITESGVWRFYK